MSESRRQTPAVTHVAADALAPWTGTPARLAESLRWALFDRAAAGVGRSDEGRRLGGFVRKLAANWAARAISGGDGMDVTDDDRAAWLGREAGVNPVWLRLLEEGCLQPAEIPVEALLRVAARTGTPMREWPWDGIRWMAAGMSPPERGRLLGALVTRDSPGTGVAGLG